MLHKRTVAVYCENNTADTNRRLLCSSVVQQVTLHSVTAVRACVRACVRTTSEYFPVYHETTVLC